MYYPSGMIFYLVNSSCLTSRFRILFETLSKAERQAFSKNKQMGRKNSTKKKHKGGSSTGKTLKGVLEITRSGMGFVVVPSVETDILIRHNDLNMAMHGDTVIVRVKKGNGRRLQGEV